MFVKSQLYPKRYAFFLQFLLIFCSCCGTALAGRSWRRLGLTLNIFCQPLRTCLALQYPRVSSVERRDGSEPCGRSLFTDSSTFDALRRPCSIFGVLLEEPIRRSSMTMTSLLRETETFFFSCSSSCLGSRCSWRAARSSAQELGARTHRESSQKRTGERRRMDAAG